MFQRIKDLLFGKDPPQPCFEYDENAALDPTCKACMSEIGVHVDKNTGERMHLDFFATAEYGITYPCPTQDWPDEEPEEPLS
jgi:hypothetical protein